MSRVFKKGEVLSPDANWTGTEPTWKGWENWTEEEFAANQRRIFSFYGYYLGIADVIGEVHTWMSKHGYNDETISKFKSLPLSSIPLTIGKLVRSLHRGMPATRPNSNRDYVQDVKTLIDECLSQRVEKPEVIKEVTQSKVSKAEQQLNREVLPNLVGWLDEQIENYLTGVDDNPKPVCIQSLELPKSSAVAVLNWIDANVKEFEEYLSSDCSSEIKEGYSVYKKVFVKRLVAAFNQMREECQAIAPAKSSRKLKAKDPTKVLSKLQWMESSDDYDVKSINPMNLLKARIIITFNVRYKNINVYHVDKSFSVKGTTLIGYDNEKSFTTKINRIDKVKLAEFKSNLGKKKFLEKFTTRVDEKEVNGRFNENTIILHIV